MRAKLIDISAEWLLEANKLMSQVMETAAESPFSVTELATGAKQLLSYGMQAEDVNGTLIQLGNIASGLGAT